LFKRNDKTTLSLIQSLNEYINDHFHSPFVIKCQKGNEKEQGGLLLIIILGVLIGGILILILIRVGDLAVVVGFFFLGLFLFIKDFLATRRRATRACRSTGASTWARKWSMSSSNGGLCDTQVIAWSHPRSLVCCYVQNVAKVCLKMLMIRNSDCLYNYI
jgi:hypothetical protein